MIGYRYINELVADICNADNVMDSLHIYKGYKDNLKGWRFVLSSDEGIQPGFALNKKFSSGAFICSLFSSDKVFVLDEVTVDEMKSGESTFLYDYSISLDTEAFSYLVPFLSNKETDITKKYNDVFEFIARDDVNVDPNPYLLENQMNIINNKRLDKISLVSR